MDCERLCILPRKKPAKKKEGNGVISILENIERQLGAQATKNYGVKVKNATTKIIYKITNFLKVTTTSYAPITENSTSSPITIKELYAR